MRKILLLVLVVLGLLAIVAPAMAGPNDDWFASARSTTHPYAVMPGGGETPD